MTKFTPTLGIYFGSLLLFLALPLVTRDCNTNPVMLVAVLANAAHYHSLLFVSYSSGANFSTFTEYDSGRQCSAHTTIPFSYVKV